MSNEVEKLENDFPSIKLAYEIAVDSFDMMIKRLDSLDGRIQTLTTFAVTACLAIPTLGKSQDLPFTSMWFILGIITLLLAIGISVYTRITGEVDVLSPSNLWEDSLHLPQIKFKSYTIFYASESFKANNKLLNKKWRLSVISMAIFALSLIFLFLWLVSCC